MLKGLILAGGTGSRLLPVTKIMNKHVIPVGMKPMIYHPLEKLAEAGIKEVLIVTGTEHLGDIVALVKDGRDFGLDVSYKVQHDAGGISQALYLAKDFVNDSPFVTILGDNIFQDNLSAYTEKWRHIVYEDHRRPLGMIILKEVADSHRFGVAVIENGLLKRIVEKPSIPALSKLAVTGIYFYCGKTLFNYIESLKPSARNELEISDLNNKLIESNTLYTDTFIGYWSDCGTWESLQHTNRLLGESL